MILKELESKKLICPPKWMATNTMYLTIIGSVACAVSTDDSDMDLAGFCVPEKSLVFPHLAGEIEGFGKQKKRFEQWQEHGIIDPHALGGRGRKYDFNIYSIVGFFNLCMKCNPNMVTSLFTPLNCVVHSTKIGNLVRENRKLFLHKGAYHRFLGYAHSQLHKMSIKNPEEGSKRRESIEKWGFDVKYAQNLIRMADECEQILTLGDIDIQRSKEHMKACRRGDISEKEIREWFSERERTLEKAYADSKLQHSPDELAIKELLLHCLEDHYGSLEKAYVKPNSSEVALRQIQEILDKLNIAKKSWWRFWQK